MRAGPKRPSSWRKRISIPASDGLRKSLGRGCAVGARLADRQVDRDAVSVLLEGQARLVDELVCVVVLAVGELVAEKIGNEPGPDDASLVRRSTILEPGGLAARVVRQRD